MKVKNWMKITPNRNEWKIFVKKTKTLAVELCSSLKKKKNNKKF